MQDKIIVRLFAYLKLKGIPHTRFEKEVGLSNGYLKIQLRRNADLGESVINKIIENCLDLDAVWLLTGKGDMIKNMTPNNDTHYNTQTINSNIKTDTQSNKVGDISTSPITKPNDYALSNKNLSPSLSPNKADDFNPSDPKWNADFAKSEGNNICSQCTEKERVIEALMTVIASKQDVIQSKEEIIRCKDELINELTRKSKNAARPSE